VDRIKWLLFIAIFVLILGCSVETSTLKIGALLPLETEMGEAQHNALLMALEEVENVELIVKDSGLNGKTALMNAQELISISKVDVIVGPSIGSAVAAITPLAEEANVMFISPAVTNPNAVNGNHVFRTSVSFEFDVERFVQEIEDNGYEKILIIESTSPWIKGTAETFANQLDTLNVKYFLRTVRQDQDDFKTLLFMVNDPDAIFLLTYPEIGEKLLNHIEEMGVVSNVYGLRTMLNVSLLERNVTYSYLNSNTEDWFVEKYKNKFDVLPDETADAAYDAFMLLARLHTNEDLFAVCSSYEGACGLVNFNSKGDLVREVTLIN
jgi:ABC-type branched-subunit amino acid transport system substrate-binding protein